ncbi:ABC transporter permease [Roseovarius sp.]|uniref:ABC transporter permease n=1 Tax=Roseovarius sp. TaxID=1486281 RepID=UPI00262B711D|nr:ABC transporter permease [Roseovarius sp.]MDM8165594.1 ABC transporter permease [Roseovarius sp.]
MSTLVKTMALAFNHGRLTVICALLGVLVLTSVFAPWIAPYGEAQVFPEPFAPWSPEHWLGTDQIGRDILTRLLYGTRNSILIALLATVLAFVIGGIFGLIAAILGGVLDQLLARLTDVLMAIPSLIFALMLLSIFGSTIWNLIVVIAVLESTRVFRLARSVSYGVVVQDYVEVARLRGERLPWIMLREVAPNITAPMLSEFGLRFCFVFLTIAALSFLGVGVQPPTADLGSMVRENANLIQFARFDLRAGITPLVPAIVIALITVSVNALVDWFLLSDGDTPNG